MVRFAGILIIGLVLSGCASTGIVLERIDGELQAVKYWSIKGPQKTSYTADSFSTDNKAELIPSGLFQAVGIQGAD